MELAFNLNGERFDVPATAAWWRVRRLRDVPRGGPEVVFARDGLPLVISIDAGIDELRRSVDDVPGKYRLDPVDERHQPVPDVPAAYIHIAKQPERNAGPPSTATAIELAKVDPRDELLRDVVRANADVIKTIADRFAGVMEAAAVLLTAADGAGLPARPGMAIAEIDEEDDEDNEPSDGPARPNLDVMSLIGQFLPLICALAGSRGIDMSKVGAMLGQAGSDRKIGKSTATTSTPKAKHEPATGGRSKPDAATSAGPRTAAVSKHSASDDDEDDDLRVDGADSLAVDPMTRFLEIQAALTPEERRIVQSVIATVAPSELAAWRDQLGAMTVAAAVQRVREEIAKLKELSMSAEDAAVQHVHGGEIARLPERSTSKEEVS